MEGGEYLETMRKEDLEQEGKNQDNKKDNILPIFQYWLQSQNDHLKVSHRCFIIRENPAARFA